METENEKMRMKSMLPDDMSRMTIPIIIIRDGDKGLLKYTVESVAWEKSDSPTVENAGDGYGRSDTTPQKKVGKTPVIYKVDGYYRVTQDYFVDYVDLPRKINHLPTIRMVGEMYGKSVAMFLCCTTSVLIKDVYYYDVAMLCDKEILEKITEMVSHFRSEHPLMFLDVHLASLGVYRFDIDFLGKHLRRYGYENNYEPTSTNFFSNGKLREIELFVKSKFGKRLEELIICLFDRDYICKVKGM